MSDFQTITLERTKDNTEKFFDDLKSLSKAVVLHEDDTALQEDLHFVALLNMPCMQSKHASKLIKNIIEIDEDDCLINKSQRHSALHCLRAFMNLLAEHVPDVY